MREGDMVEWLGQVWEVVTVWNYEKRVELGKVGTSGKKEWVVVQMWEVTKLEG